MRHLSDDDLDIIGIYLSERILGRLDRIERALNRLTHNQGEIVMDLTQLTAAVSADTDAVASATTLLGQLAQALRDAAGDPAAVNELAAQLDANTAALSAAVVANTPATTAPPAEPPPATPPPAPGFVAKLEGETYADYAGRVSAWNADPANAQAQVAVGDEASWGALPVG